MEKERGDQPVRGGRRERESEGVGRHGNDTVSTPAAGGEVLLQDARVSPDTVDELEVFQRARHLLRRQAGLVEELERGAAGGDKKRHYACEITSALFFDPKPMQLHRACSKDALRA